VPAIARDLRMVVFDAFQELNEGLLTLNKLRQRINKNKQYVAMTENCQCQEWQVLVIAASDTKYYCKRFDGQRARLLVASLVPFHVIEDRPLYVLSFSIQRLTSTQREQTFYTGSTYSTKAKFEQQHNYRSASFRLEYKLSSRLFEV
jgi:hypothetical protein